MISARDISIDEEISYYSVAFSGGSKKETMPLVDDFCLRCGEHGHLAECCSNVDTNLEGFIENYENRVKKLSNDIAEEFQLNFDAFGPYCSRYMTSPSEESWETTVFCTNCGDPDHVWNKCPHLPFSKIMSDLFDIHDSFERRKIYNQKF